MTSKMLFLNETENSESHSKSRKASRLLPLRLHHTTIVFSTIPTVDLLNAPRRRHFKNPKTLSNYLNNETPQLFRQQRK
jgi:hypothetical protein